MRTGDAGRRRGLPSSAALGSVLPLWIRDRSADSNLLGARVGRLLTWNTIGAVVGVLLTGFVLMPHIGLRGSFATLGLVLTGVALVIALRGRRQLAIAGAVCVTIFLLVVLDMGGAHWRTVISSGAFRWREKTFTATEMPTRIKSDRLFPLLDQAFVDHIQHFQKGHIRQNILSLIGFKAA